MQSAKCKIYSFECQVASVEFLELIELLGLLEFIQFVLCYELRVTGCRLTVRGWWFEVKGYR